MDVALIAPCTIASGNRTTTGRLVAMLRDLSYRCTVIDSNQPLGPVQLQQLQAVDVCIALHAMRAGRHLIGKGVFLCLASPFLETAPSPVPFSAPPSLSIVCFPKGLFVFRDHKYNTHMHHF